MDTNIISMHGNSSPLSQLEFANWHFLFSLLRTKHFCQCSEPKRHVPAIWNYYGLSCVVMLNGEGSIRLDMKSNQKR